MVSTLLNSYVANIKSADINFNNTAYSILSPNIIINANISGYIVTVLGRDLPDIPYLLG